MRRAVIAWMVVAAAGACRPGGRGEAKADAEAKGDAEAKAKADADADAKADAPAPAMARADAERVVTDWCIEGMSALDEDVCYVLPPLAEGQPRQLLVYLHGIVPPVPVSVQKTTVQSAVLHAATRAGAAAIVPRGRRGIGPEGAHDWWAWPTDPGTHARLAKELVTRWAAAKKKLEGIAGAPFARTYLAGSSNGAYFLAALAFRGDAEDLGFPIDGYGAMSGGAPGGRPPDALARHGPRPLYIGFGAYDEESKRGAKALASAASAAHWPVKLAEHPFGHGAREIYLDEAFAFWPGAR
ncbi:MAG TPA: hypothetical protein VLT33_29405 [Labilithrix sp.]|nr:hypothetical protein [Labilithrix sp.]